MSEPHTPRIRFQTSFPMGFVVDIEPLEPYRAHPAVFVKPFTLDARVVQMTLHHCLVESQQSPADTQRIIEVARAAWEASR